jgi:hypothetical protein
MDLIFLVPFTMKAVKDGNEEADDDDVNRHKTQLV